MKKLLLALSAIFLFNIVAHSAIKDTTNTNIQSYNDEIGFFQRANRDMNDPRFMFYDSKSGMEFGVGGSARVSGYYGFGGQVEGESFIPSTITLPNDNAPRFGTKISDSEVHFKARYRFTSKRGNQHSFIAFIKMGGNDNNMIELKQAYISYDGFSLGKIPSFFNDLEIGVKTTGICANSVVDLDQPLFGYTHRFKNGIELAGAIEYSDHDVNYYADYFTYMYKIGISKSAYQEVRTNYSSIPDFTLHAKWRMTNGHIQLAALFRDLTYWSRTADYDFGDNGHSFGYGLSLSGSWRPMEANRLIINAALAGGRGIGNYLADYKQISYLFGINGYDSNGRRLMSSAPLVATQLSCQYKWNSYLQSSFLVSYRSYLRDSDASYWYKHSSAKMGEIRGTACALANLIWNIGDYAHLGIEYMFGAKQLYTSPNYLDKNPQDEFHGQFAEWGFANRVAVEFAFFF